MKENQYNAMKEALLSQLETAIDKASIVSSSVDDGQTVISSVNRTPSEIIKDLSALDSYWWMEKTAAKSA